MAAEEDKKDVSRETFPNLSPKFIGILDFMADGLTQTQKRVLQFVDQEINARGYAPTLKAIATEMGWKSHCTANDVVRALVRKGVLVRDKNRPIRRPVKV